MKSRWEGELMIKLLDRCWENALLRINSSSSCARWGLIQFKVVHRAHSSRARLADIYPGMDGSCNRRSLSLSLSLSLTDLKHGLVVSLSKSILVINFS